MQKLIKKYKATKLLMESLNYNYIIKIEFNVLAAVYIFLLNKKAFYLLTGLNEIFVFQLIL